jgi:hypothetical protein
MAKSFKAQIDAIADMTEKNLSALVVDSVQDVLELAQTSQPSVKQTGGSFEIGKIPVDERDLIQSLEVGYNRAYQPTRGATTLSLAGFQLGYTINARWTAAHALPMELGFTTRNGGSVAGRHFLGHNAAKWPAIVAANVKKWRI